MSHESLQHHLHYLQNMMEILYSLSPPPARANDHVDVDEHVDVDNHVEENVDDHVDVEEHVDDIPPLEAIPEIPEIQMAQSIPRTSIHNLYNLSAAQPVSLWSIGGRLLRGIANRFHTQMLNEIETVMTRLEWSVHDPVHIQVEEYSFWENQEEEEQEDDEKQELTPEEILHQLEHVGVVSKAMPGEVSQCSICFDDMEGDFFQTTCVHSFHPKCLYEWVRRKSNCPVCRHDF